MAKPIGQTFSVNDLEVEGVFLTKIRLYFREKDATKGIGGNIKGIFNKATDFLSNPSLSRLGISGLLPGGQGKAGGGCHP